MSELEWIDERAELTLAELCRAVRLDAADVKAWVTEGMLDPAGRRPEEWRFGGESLRRAAMARRLSRDLDINAAGLALVVDLLDEIAALERRLGER